MYEIVALVPTGQKALLRSFLLPDLAQPRAGANDRASVTTKLETGRWL